MSSLEGIVESTVDSVTKDQVVTYTCVAPALGVNDTTQTVEIPAYYDLAYPCNIDATKPEPVADSIAKQQIVDLIASSLLDMAATVWGILPDGIACTNSSHVFRHIRVLSVSSAAKDSFAELECQTLVPTGADECCSVVASNMTVTVETPIDSMFENELGITAVIAEELDASVWDVGFDIRTSFIGAELEILPEQGKYGVPESTPIREAPRQEDDSRFTVFGGFVVATMALLITAAIWTVRRRGSQDKTPVMSEADEIEMQMEQHMAAANRDAIFRTHRNENGTPEVELEIGVRKTP